MTNLNQKEGFKMERKSNAPLIIILAAFAFSLFIVCILVFTSKSSDKDTDQTTKAVQEQTDNSDQIETAEKTVQETAEKPQEQTSTESSRDNVKDIEYTTMYVANVANSIYLRSQPEEVESNIITSIPLGTQVVWMEDVTPVFSKVSYGGTTGYVKRDYLSAKKPEPKVTYTPPANTTIQKYVYVANVANSIYLRSQPKGNSSNIITTIPLGTRVGFIEYTNNTFSKINYNGTIGYAKTIYLSDYYSSTTYMTVYNVKHSIYLRSAPYENPNNIICEIPLGSVVTYISNGGNGFYKISWNGYTGYSKSKYLR